MINKIDLNLSKIEAKLGFFGSPLAMGAILGVIIGMLGALPFSEIIKSGMNFAAVMVLLPTMAGVLVSGLVADYRDRFRMGQKAFP
ncbi:PTS system, galactitol-specific IIC component [Serratia fonticola]|uniref:PTS system, galactitol-specific IIC component n=1 Tax=Serratia fonticola TaxID=47917 RepID=A0A4U9TZP2_SERFO|nr:PTS system, galactitol-specific IIC component [Serratia fonticola]